MGSAGGMLVLEQNGFESHIGGQSGERGEKRWNGLEPLAKLNRACLMFNGASHHRWADKSGNSDCELMGIEKVDSHSLA